MFAPSTSAFVLTLPILAVANVLPRNDGGGGPTNQCPTGTLYCCNMLVAPTNPSASTLLGLLGIVPGSVTSFVGLTCSPITLVGSAPSCIAQPACCTGTNFGNGLLVLGCSPINTNV